MITERIGYVVWDRWRRDPAKFLDGVSEPMCGQAGIEPF